MQHTICRLNVRVWLDRLDKTILRLHMQATQRPSLATIAALDAAQTFRVQLCELYNELPTGGAA